MDSNAIEENSGDIVSLLETLVPKDLVIFDLEGNKYKLPSKISARRQIKALRVVEQAGQLMSTIDAPAEAFGDVQAMLKVATTLLSDDRVLDILDEAFEACYPGITQGFDGNPTDNFDVEELIKSFGPLAVAFAKTMTKAGTLLSR